MECGIVSAKTGKINKVGATAIEIQILLGAGLALFASRSLIRETPSQKAPSIAPKSAIPVSKPTLGASHRRKRLGYWRPLAIHCSWVGRTNPDPLQSLSLHIRCSTLTLAFTTSSLLVENGSYRPFAFCRTIFSREPFSRSQIILAMSHLLRCATALEDHFSNSDFLLPSSAFHCRKQAEPHRHASHCFTSLEEQ